MENTDLKSLTAYIEDAEITMSCKPIPSRKDWSVDECVKNSSGASHWQITLSNNYGSLMLEYTQGAAFRVWKSSCRQIKDWVGQFSSKPKAGERLPPFYNKTIYQEEMIALHSTPELPDVCNVVGCILADASSVDGYTFKEWAEDFGFNSDSIKAKSCYDQCCEHGIIISRMFGEAYADASQAAQDL